MWVPAIDHELPKEIVEVILILSSVCICLLLLLVYRTSRKIKTARFPVPIQEKQTVKPWEDTNSLLLDDYEGITEEDAKKMSNERLFDIYSSLKFHLERQDDYLTERSHKALFEVSQILLKEVRARNLNK